MPKNKINRLIARIGPVNLIPASLLCVHSSQGKRTSLGFFFFFFVIFNGRERRLIQRVVFFFKGKQKLIIIAYR